MLRYLRYLLGFTAAFCYFFKIWRFFAPEDGTHVLKHVGDAHLPEC